MNKTNVLNTIRSNYINFDKLKNNTHEMFENLASITNDDLFIMELERLIEQLDDSHTKLHCGNNNKFILPIFLGIVENDIIVLESELKISRVERGYKLVEINGVAIEDLISKDENRPTRTLKLMKILENISSSYKKEIITLTFMTIESTYASRQIVYERIEVLNFIYSEMNKIPNTMKKMDFDIDPDVTYFKIPSLMNIHEMLITIEHLKQCIKTEYILIDLRYNIGGRLDMAVKLTELLVNKENYIYLKSRNGIECLKISPQKSFIRNKKIGILHNYLTSSSLEFVFLRSLVDEDVVFIGTDTTGMKDVATIYKIDSSNILSLTTKKYVYSNGEEITLELIKPNVYVNTRFEDFMNRKDNQLNKAVAILKESDDRHYLNQIEV